MDPAFTERTWRLAAAALTHGVIVSLLAWLLRRRRPTGERQGAAVLLRYPPAWHLLSWCLLLLPFVGLAFVAWRFPPKPDDIVWLAGMAVGFAVTGTYLVVEVTGLSHELQPNGLVRHGAWRPRRFLPWSQVTAIRYSALACMWRVRTSSGDGAWVPLWVSGVGDFARAALAHVPPEVIDRDPAARLMLTRAANDETFGL